MQLRDILAKLSFKSWAVIGIAVVGGLVFITLLFQVASTPSYTTAFAGLDPAQTGKMTAELATEGIPYQLQNGGTALAVPAGDVSQARVALASAGLISPSQADAGLFTKSTLGESDSQEQVQYQVALEQQLADTIDQVQGVSSAQVLLTLPNPNTEVFSDTTQQAQAAVLLTGGNSLDPSAIRGIAELVASSVQGLSASKVAITSDTGELLWPNGSADGGGGGLALEDAESNYDQQQEAQVSGMLASTLGEGKATVVVNAQLNDDQTTTDSLTYTGKPVPTQTSTQSETLANKGGNSATGTPVAGGQTATGNSNYKDTTTQATNDVDKTVTQTTTAPGTVKSENVSVLVSTTVPSAEIPKIRTAVEAATGITPAAITAGTDNLQVNQVSFAKPPATATPTAASPSTGMMSEAKDGILGIGALLFLFFITRGLRKRESEPLANRQATWLRELDYPRSLVELEDENRPVEPLRVKRLRPAHASPAKVQVEDLVEHEPDRVASQVREWMAED
ncbi:MAG: flagellar basal-body MS-ring/collar protein FliF [Solirubrobacteraceae bacterium]|jgi:flagellar M-ring protein FliF